MVSVCVDGNEKKKWKKTTLRIVHKVSASFSFTTLTVFHASLRQILKYRFLSLLFYYLTSIEPERCWRGLCQRHSFSRVRRVRRKQSSEIAYHQPGFRRWIRKKEPTAVGNNRGFLLLLNSQLSSTSSVICPTKHQLLCVLKSIQLFYILCISVHVLVQRTWTHKALYPSLLLTNHPTLCNSTHLFPAPFKATGSGSVDQPPHRGWPHPKPSPRCQ